MIEELIVIGERPYLLPNYSITRLSKYPILDGSGAAGDR